MEPSEAALHFFLQLAVILATCRAVGQFVQRFLWQPAVVGEMIAGVLLGPSVLGALAPSVSAALFPPETQNILFVVSQLGVGLYMFIVGLTFDRREFKSNIRGAMTISLAGIIVPFISAAALTPWLLTYPRLFSQSVGELNATLFLGAAIAITAFPMLARIIHEQGISGTRVGTLSLSSGASGDAAAWVVIALVVASLGEGTLLAVKALGGGILFAAVCIFWAPRWLSRLAQSLDEPMKPDHGGVAVVLVLFAMSVWLMDAAGMHAVFGGFLLGTAMPRGKFAEQLQAKMEPLAVTLLLPIFFTYSGLHTHLQVVNSPSLFVVALVVFGLSVLSKTGACYAAARFIGEDRQTALAVGVLMNARGLMELIVINIGLQRGIIGIELFAILVVMSILTTLMTSPLFRMVQKAGAKKSV